MFRAGSTRTLGGYGVVRGVGHLYTKTRRIARVDEGFGSLSRYVSRKGRHLCTRHVHIEKSGNPTNELKPLGRNRDSQKYFKEVHMQRLAIETSWLNYSRNAMIGAVAGVGMYSANRSLGFPDILAPKLMLCVGLVFMSSGTAQYVVSLLALETGGGTMLAWGIGNASVLWGLYTSAVCVFFMEAEKIESEQAEQSVCEAKVIDLN
mmetsp:Transcript_15297/g.24884  ORF Transcript_15297/g.24884 Transcript_15297/m.24884 type:complete len:206 (+) Transcript_15297:215-832(+)